jgi:serine phosphatase RsbU (regulator of sigma subunit)
MTAEADLEGLLQFFYQCPVGLIEIDDRGAVSKINPAAARMLAPTLAGDDLTNLFPVLSRLAPDLVQIITGAPGQLGPLAVGRRILLPSGPHGQDCLEVLTVRVDYDRVMLVLLDVSEERRHAQREHELAVELQRSMLGRVDPGTGLPVSVTYRTAETELLVGGDWYDVITLPDGMAGLVIGDVVGHSITATAAMGQLRNAIRGMAPWCLDPAELMRRIDAIAEHIEGAECTTLTYAIFDKRDGTLRYASAGHPPPLVLRADSTTSYLMGGRGLPLACGWPDTYTSAQAQLDAGDTLILYTDGLIERRGESLTHSLHRLRAAATGARDLPVEQLSDALAEQLTLDGPPQDDLCILALHHPDTAAVVDPTAPQISTTFSSQPPNRVVQLADRRFVRECAADVVSALPRRSA